MRFQQFIHIGLRKSAQLDIAITLEDLEVPPGNREVKDKRSVGYYRTLRYISFK